MSPTDDEMVLVDELIDDILMCVAQALRKEHGMFRTYQPITLIEWLRRQ